MRAYNFVEAVYETNIIYLVGGSFEEMIKFLKTKHGHTNAYSWDKKVEWGEDANTTDAYQFHVNALHGEGETFYVWIHIPTASLLYHETSHLAGDILYIRGIRYSADSEEAFAYLGGWIFNKIFSLIKRKIIVSR